MASVRLMALDRYIRSLIEEQHKAVPRIFFERMIGRKLKADGIEMPSTVLKQFVDHLLSGATEKFLWDNGGPDKTYSLAITSNDMQEVETEIRRWSESLPKILPGVLDRATEKTALDAMKRLKKSWPNEVIYQDVEIENFKANLHARWAVGIERLQMMLTLGRQVGERYHKSLRRRKPSILQSTLSRLHARACQVAGEIISLLQNGYANGALARWRTLHEINVVATLLANVGEEMASRYVDHQAVEAKRASTEYEASRVQLGMPPLSKRDCRQIDRDYRASLIKYGKSFGGPYGWAEPYLSAGSNPNFRDLEAAAGRAALRTYYKLASDNVHAGPRGAFFSLTNLAGSSPIVAGPSNTGLDEPGRLTAHVFAQITYFVWRQPWTIADQVNMRLMLMLRDEAVRAFGKAAQKLLKDELAYRRVMATRRENDRARRRRSKGKV